MKTRRVKLGAAVESGAGCWTCPVQVGREHHGRVTVTDRGEVLDGTVFLTDAEAAAARALALGTVRRAAKVDA